jgi:hypothetical protein
LPIPGAGSFDEDEPALFVPPAFPSVAQADSNAIAATAPPMRNDQPLDLNPIAMLTPVSTLPVYHRVPQKSGTAAAMSTGR